MARVFLSHASEDLALAFELHRWLVDDGHEVFLDRDLRDGIAVGEQWKQQLHERLRWANAVVCVVTSTYLVSEWCTAEVNTALSRGNRLLPVRAEPGVTHALLTSIQHTDLASDQVAAHASLAEALRRVDAAGDPEWPEDRSPFPGLRPFDVDRHRVFFGRTRETEQLAGLLQSMAERAENTALLVVGPSGCGKSSLVRAGLLPVMAGEPGGATLPPMVPGADPVAALARGLAAAAQQIGLGWTVDQVHSHLVGDGLRKLAEALLSAAPGSARRLLVVVDQFEELFTQARSADRTRFAELLEPALAGPVQLVATLRSESLDHLLGDSALSSLQTQVYTLRPLRHEALRTIIEEPARMAGIEVDEHLVARLIEDTDTGDALPLLAFTLAQLADGIRQGGRLSSARYEKLGGVRGALTREADAALAEAVTAGRRNREQVIAGLLRLVTVDEQGRPTRRRINRDELPDPVRTELGAFTTRRLLSTDTNNGTVVIGVAHEAFLSAWPPLAAAITGNVSALRARRAVEHAATEWHDTGRSSVRLWGGGQLAAAVADTGASIRAATALVGTPPRRGSVRWSPQRHRALVTDRVDLSSNARDFLHASIRHDRFRRRRTTTVLSVLLVVALVAAGIALIQQRRAEDQQRIAEAGQLAATGRQLVAQAEVARDTNPPTALRLGLAAYRLHPNGETHASLVNTLTSTHYANTLIGHTDWVSSVAFFPDGQTLATGSADGTVILWDLADRAEPVRLGAPLTGHTDRVNSVAVSPDGQTLATGGYDDTVILWDLADRTEPVRLGAPLTGHTGPVNSVAFAPDGQTLATGGYDLPGTGSADGTVILWDLADRTEPVRLGAPLTGHTGPVSSVAFASDGQTLATASWGLVILWDLADRAQPGRLGDLVASHADSLRSVAFAPDGQTLATGGNDRTVILWDLADRAQPVRLGAPLTGHTGPVRSVTFAPDGQTLATGSEDRTVRLWDLTDRTQPVRLGAPLTGHTDWVNSVAFAPDGQTLATGGADGPVSLWDLADRAQPVRLGAPLTGHTGTVNSVAFAPDGQTPATGGEDLQASGGAEASVEYSVILWDLTDRTQPVRLGAPLTGHTNSVSSVAFAPDGQTLAIGSADSSVSLWDLADRAQPVRLGAPLTGHTGQVNSVAFAPDGLTLAIGGADGPVSLWDMADRTQPVRLGAPLTGHTGTVNSVAFAPDGQTLATGSGDQTVILWDLADRTQPVRLGAPLTGHTDWVNSVAFAPDGQTLATGSEDETLILWDLADRTRPVRLGAPLTGHTSPVSSVAFAPDGQTLATGSHHRTVILWDAVQRTQPGRLNVALTGQAERVSSVAFAPDGQTLATGGIEGHVILWDLQDLSYLLDHAVERACAIAGGGFDREEWDRRILGLPYRETCFTG